MKNRQASRTKALISVIKKAKRAILLTGTPALARPEEVRGHSQSYQTFIRKNGFPNQARWEYKTVNVARVV